MATAVASQLEKKFEGDEQAPFVVFISLSSTSKLSKKETAMDAILSRVAYELDNNSKELSFYQFLKRYFNFDAIIDWIEWNKVILLIDELNIIEPKRAEYGRMSLFLDALAGRKGSALLYTTHHRLEKDLLQGRPHCWQPMPRLNTEACIRHMKRTEHFWSAVLRGRIPALLVLDQHLIDGFMPGTYQDDASRHLLFNAILDGNIDYLEAGRKTFRAYSCLLRNEDGEPIHVSPPFLCAQKAVLGKACPHLRAVLEAPDTNPSKAFAALAELAVARHLMSSSPRYHHNLIPRHSGVSLDDAFAATAIFEIGAEAQTIKALRIAVDDRLAKDNERYASVMQMVVIPLFSEFPIYDFFLFHRHRCWRSCPF